MSITSFNLALFLFTWWLAFFIAGFYYFYNANNWSKSLNATLFKVEIKTIDKTQINLKYQIDEYFYKYFNSTEICKVTKLKIYNSKNEVEEVAKHLKLNEKKRIYQISNSNDICLDDKSRYYWNCYGLILLIISILPFLTAIVVIYYMRRNIRTPLSLYEMTNRYDYQSIETDEYALSV